MRIHRFFPAAALAALAACQPNTTTPAARTMAEMPADQIVYGVSHTVTNEGIRQAFVHGDSAYVRDEGRQHELFGVKVEFFDENGGRSGELTSLRGEYVPTTRRFIARDNVVLVMTSPQGQRRLETQELHFDPNMDQISSPVPFVMRAGGETSRGQGFTSDTKFRNYTVQGAQGRIPGREITF